jgi:hypothetical protein
MEFLCLHCEKRTEGTPYRVYSEESGVTLIDQLTCSVCAVEAKKLNLTALKFTLPGEAPALRVLEPIQKDLIERGDIRVHGHKVLK